MMPHKAAMIKIYYGLRYGITIKKKMIKPGPVPNNLKDTKGGTEFTNETPVKISKSGWDGLKDQSNQTVTTTKTVEVDSTESNNNGFITATELFDKGLDEIPMLISPIFQKVGIAAVIGSSDTGKSSFLRQLAYEVASGGMTFLGFRINATHHRAIYISTEDDEDSMSFLLRKQYGNPHDSTKTNRLKYIFQSENLLMKLNTEMTRNPVDLVVVDAFSDLYGGDMNSSNQVRNYMDKYSNLAKKHKCLIIFLHHTGKRIEYTVPGKDNALGSQGFESKVRLLIELRKDPEFTGIRHFCIVKGNYQPDQFKTHSIVMSFNENMLFANLQLAVPFEELVKVRPGSNNMVDAKARASELRDQGLSVRKVSENLKNEGYDVSKTTVGEWSKKK